MHLHRTSESPDTTSYRRRRSLILHISYTSDLSHCSLGRRSIRSLDMLLGKSRKVRCHSSQSLILDAGPERRNHIYIEQGRFAPMSKSSPLRAGLSLNWCKMVLNPHHRLQPIIELIDEKDYEPAERPTVTQLQKNSLTLND